MDKIRPMLHGIRVRSLESVAASAASWPQKVMLYTNGSLEIVSGLGRSVARKEKKKLRRAYKSLLILFNEILRL